MVNVKIHTGCGCYMCKKGRNKPCRQKFHRKVRHLQKKQLKNTGEIRDIDVSIGYTD